MLRNKNHDFRNRTAIRAVVVAVALGCFSLGAFARGYAPVSSPLPTGFNVKFASNGTPLATMVNGSSAVAVTAGIGVPLTASATLQAFVTGAIGGAQFGGAWGAALAGVGAVALFAVPGLLDAYRRAGLRVNPVTSALERTDPDSCTVAPCNLWAVSGATAGQNASSGWQSGPMAAAAAYSAALLANSGNMIIATPTSCSKPSNNCTFSWRYSSESTSNTSIVALSKGALVAPSTNAYVPSTPAQATAAITANAPTSVEVQALVDLNFPPVVAPVSLTGPAELPLFNTVTLDSKGVQTTVAEKATVTYFPDSAAVKRTKTTTVVTPPVAATPENPTGTPGKTEVTTTTDDTKPEDKRSECEKNPLTLGCSELDTPGGDIPRSSATISYTAETPFGSGSCPANLTSNIATLGKTVTVWDWQKTCDMALPLRALVLALASFAAFLIVMPGETRT